MTIFKNFPPYEPKTHGFTARNYPKIVNQVIDQWRHQLEEIVKGNMNYLCEDDSIIHMGHSQILAKHLLEALPKKQKDQYCGVDLCPSHR